MKTLRTIIEEHQQAMATLEKEKAEVDRRKVKETEIKAQQQAKAREAWESQLRKGKEWAEAFKGKITELYDMIEAWVEDVPDTSFERNQEAVGAILTIAKIQIVFESQPEKVQAGVNTSTVPWQTILLDPVSINSRDDSWYIAKFKENPVPLDQARFCEQIESWFKSVQRGLAQQL